MKGLDLRKFVKMKSDAKKTVLKHPDGHTIHIARGSLSPKMQKDLDALPFADGGIVPEYARQVEAGVTGKKVEKPKEQVPGVTSTQRTPASADPDASKQARLERQKAAFNSQMGVPMADGGEVKDVDLDNPTIPDVELPDAAPPSEPAQDVSSSQSLGYTLGKAISAPYKIASSLGEAVGSSLRTNVADPIASGVQGAVQAVAGQPLAPIPSSASVEALPSQDNAQITQPAQEPAPAAVSPAAPQPQSALTQGMQSEMAGLQHKYEAEKAEGQGKATALEQAQKQQADAAAKFDSRMAELTAERKAVLSDKIDPNHFWASKTTGGKIATIIGMLVGGLGGNDTTKWLNAQIDQDIDAQKSNKSNVLHGLEQQFQDTRVASDFHRVLMNDQVSHALSLAEAKASTPLARANLEMARGQLQKQNGMLMIQINAHQALNNGKPNQAEAEHAINTLRMVDPAKAKEAEQRFVPGVGVASVPVNDKTREGFSAGQTFMQQMDALEKFRQQHRGALIGAAADEGHRLAELARNSFRIAQGEGVFKAGSQQFNEKLIPDPTELDIMGKNKNAYGDMKSQALRELQSSAKTHGIKPFDNSPIIPQESQYLEWAKKNPKDPRAKIVLQRAGGK